MTKDGLIKEFRTDIHRNKTLGSLIRNSLFNEDKNSSKEQI